MTETERARAAVREARELLVKEGWCQHRTRDSSGRRCMVGAVHAVTDFSTYWEVQHLLERELECNPIVWNDSPGRTEEEVLSLMEKVAA